jgi:DNA invertase Pin-like site-specific DNA recombinase
MSKRVALYLRVSTTEQTVENQQRELEAVADRHGWNVVAIFTDAGISGTKGRDKRPGYDRLCRGITRRERAMIVERVKPHFRGFDLNNIDYQWLAGHLAF